MLFQIKYKNSKQASLHSRNKNPEDDPDWPKEVITLADIVLRNEIKSRYYTLQTK